MFKLVRIMKIVVTFCYGCAINAIQCPLKRDIYFVKKRHDNDGHRVCVAFRNLLILRDIFHDLLTVAGQLRDEDLFI